MTEEEWDRCEDWRPMLAALGDGIGERKGLLYLCAGMRHIWPLFYHEASRSTVEVVERMADGRATAEEIDKIDKSDWDSMIPTMATVSDGPRGPSDATRGFLAGVVRVLQTHAAREIVAGVRMLLESGVLAEADLLDAERLRNTERRLVNAANIPHRCFNRIVDEGLLGPHMLGHLSAEPEWPGGWLVREIFGNPFRPPRFDPAWQTPDVVGLARTIYDEKAFDRLPILSDALLDAGCHEDRIVAHCREVGPHARGCWVVDRVLGLE